VLTQTACQTKYHSTKDAVGTDLSEKAGGTAFVTPSANTAASVAPSVAPSASATATPAPNAN
jgi:hypothetical protein